VSRQPYHARRVHRTGKLAAGLEKGFKRFGGLVVRNHHNNHLPRCSRHQRQVHRARRSREAGHTPPPRPQAQMPSYALKSRRVLQLREDFADKRENHEIPVYQ
jgi:hypothetical protein